MGNSDLKNSYILSPMQAGMLFQNLYGSKAGVDIEQLVCTFADVNISILETAWQQVWQTQEVLRTGFDWLGLEEPVQRIHQNIPLPWKVLDWRSHSGDFEERLENFLRQDRLAGFNLNQPPLMRLTLIQTGEGKSRLIWTYHHILLDGRSLPPLLKQMAEAYQASCQEKPITLTPFRPYRDYVAWLSEQVWSDENAYWKERLRGVKNPTPLSVNHSQPSLPDDELDYEVLKIHLSPELTGSLKQFAEHHSLTLNTLLQGAWAILLSRYSGERDIVYGAIRSVRRSALNDGGAGDMVGLLINTLPVRIRVDPQMPVLQILKDLRAFSLQLRSSLVGHVPLAEIQKMSELHPGIRLFESILGFENLEFDEMLKAQHDILSKWDFELLEHVGYPIVATAYGGNRLKICLEYSRELFDAETASRILAHLHTLLKGIVEDPSCPVWKIPLLAEQERHQIVEEWNDTRVEYTQDQCVQDLFEAQVERTPDAVAAVSEDRQLTYRELNQRANQLAHYLQKRGVGPDALVGVYIERSLEMIVALLGILKAGGAYVPIDPSYPAERQKYIIRDSGVSILLTQENLLEEVKIFGTGELICLDCDWLEIAEEVDTNPRRETTPDHLAYVIYTSGSTGLPKGTMIVHRGLTNYLNWCLRAYPAKEGQGSPVHSSLSFDLTVTSIYPALLCGQKIWLLPERMGIESLEWIMKDEMDFSLIKITPAHLRLLNEHMNAADIAGKTRAFIIGGENLYAEHVNFWLERAPDTVLVNEYGPTETVVGCCVYTIPAGTKPQGVIPIGRPIDNTQLYVLDEYLQPTPAGVAGELHIGGAGVARGYLNQPELTEQKFIPNPFSSNPEDRLYKTGDRVRWLSDGNLEFLGRLDFQVKIRGYRIELGEIESVLEQIPAIWQVVVVARMEDTGENRLAAYVTLADEAQKEDVIPDLRDYLKQKLPDYMIPSAFVILEKMPMTPNGKIDRAALPEPDISRKAERLSEARTPIEKKLTDIWSDVLGVERVGIDDNFFDLGGHSLLAIRLFARLRAALGLDLSLRMLFEAPTIADLAKQIENIIWVTRQSSQNSTGGDKDYEEIIV